MPTRLCFAISSAILLAACAGSDSIDGANTQRAAMLSESATAATRSAPEAADFGVVDQRAANTGPSDDDLICRREQVTGSHRRVRRCYTRAQRDSMRDDAQQYMRDRFQGAAAADDEGQ